ncbi:hypothetical protein EON62_03175 [archaeon]|nr:MAG: hypothetical protein EON62_03175 [archaeon]
MFTCLCVGPALFIGGIVLLTVSSIDRTTNVNTYNAAVSTWEDGMGYLTWLGIPQNSFRITADATVNASQMLNVRCCAAICAFAGTHTRCLAHASSRTALCRARCCLVCGEAVVSRSHNAGTERCACRVQARSTCALLRACAKRRAPRRADPRFSCR